MMLTKICLLGLFSLGVALLFSGRPGPVSAQTPVKSNPTTEAIVQFNPPTSQLSPPPRPPPTVIVTGISRLYGLELQLSYDPTLVEVIDADPELPGVQVGLGDLFAGGNALVLTNEVTPTGRINVIAARQAPAEPFSGDGSLLTLTWRA
ncbi:MAG: hypothetical protein HC875_23980 [Anaerolineales bacterium]|nr:hypothetical protein [Anaerolineales bacterium]